MREIEVEVPADEVSKTYRTIIKRYQKLARIPGFRAGKVPESLVRSKFAKELRQEVLEALVSERFRQAIVERNLRPVSEPQLLDLQLNDGQPLRFKAAFEVLPEFDVAGYDTVKVEKPQVELTQEEFESELGRLMDSQATVEPVEEDRPLVDGDWADIQFLWRDQTAGSDRDRGGRNQRFSRSPSYRRRCADRNRRQEYAAGFQTTLCAAPRSGRS